MKKKKWKRKQRKKRILLGIKLLFLLVLFSFSFCCSLRYFVKSMDSSHFVKMLLENSSSYIEKTESPHFFTKFIHFITNLDIKQPVTFLQNHYQSEITPPSSDEEKDLDSIPSSNYVKDPYDNNIQDTPLVYLYNTHQSEEYSASNLESYNVKPTVMMLSYMLREKLNKNGIPTIVEENDVTEFLRTNNWNYAASYQVTRILMDDVYSKNPSLKYFVDLHRDSVKRSISTTTIENKTYAKILFIVGLENENYAKNLKVTETINHKIEEKYPGLSRGIYKKQGPGVNGVYNQDFSPNTILIEVGGTDNTIDEVYNTCEAISTVLTEYIKEQENEK